MGEGNIYLREIVPDVAIAQILSVSVLSIQHWPSALLVHNVHLEVICMVISDEEGAKQLTSTTYVLRAAFSSISSQRASNRRCSLCKMCAGSLSGYSCLTHHPH